MKYERWRKQNRKSPARETCSSQNAEIFYYLKTWESNGITNNFIIWEYRNKTLMTALADFTYLFYLFYNQIVTSVLGNAVPASRLSSSGSKSLY